MKATSGHPATGHGMKKSITGCRAPGSWHRNQAYSGLPDIGLGMTTDIVGIPVIGHLMWVSTAVSPTATGIQVKASMAASGGEMSIGTTLR